MRENMGLYRGKKLKTSVFDETDWIYGSLIDSGNHEQVAIYPWYDGASTMSVRQLVYARMEGVKPETVGQFTGKTDIGGMKIFEGDIVIFKDCYDGQRKGIVRYCAPEFIVEVPGRFAYHHRLIDSEHINDGKCSFTAKYKYKIIGNIHDNAELLKEAAQ